MMEDKPTSVEIDTKKYAVLQEISRKTGKGVPELLDEIILYYLSNAVRELSQDNRRQYQRKDVELPAVLQIPLNNNEIQFRRARVVNLSVGGVKVVFSDNSRQLYDRITNSETIELIFTLPDLNSAMTVVCKPLHATIGDHIELGAQFVTTSDFQRQKISNYVN